MDPNACLERINDLLARNNATPGAQDSLRDAVDDLATWLHRGGFPPDWKRYPQAAMYYQASRRGLK